MAKQLAALLSLFVVSTYLAPLVSSTPMPTWEVDILPSWEMDMAPELPTVEFPDTFGGRRVFIGYRGLSGDVKPAYASAGGELGAVYYVADAIDLARYFANGPVPAKNHVCRIIVDGDEWDRLSKVWITPPTLLAHNGNGMNAMYPGSVLFAPHANPHTPGCPPNVYQLGIREGQLGRLKIYQDCLPAASWAAGNHDTLDYHGRIAEWHIQPVLSFSGMDIWLKAGTLPMA